MVRITMQSTGKSIEFAGGDAVHLAHGRELCVAQQLSCRCLRGVLERCCHSLFQIWQITPSSLPGVRVLSVYASRLLCLYVLGMK